jgi:hypothetical protein
MVKGIQGYSTAYYIWTTADTTKQDQAYIGKGHPFQTPNPPSVSAQPTQIHVAALLICLQLSRACENICGNRE